MAWGQDYARQHSAAYQVQMRLAGDLGQVSEFGQGRVAGRHRDRPTTRRVYAAVADTVHGGREDVAHRLAYPSVDALTAAIERADASRFAGGRKVVSRLTGGLS